MSHLSLKVQIARQVPNLGHRWAPQTLTPHPPPIQPTPVHGWQELKRQPTRGSNGGIAMIRMSISMIVLLAASCPGVRAGDPLVVSVWPGLPPMETGSIGPEKVFKSAPKGNDTHVTEPTKLI